MIAGTGKIIFRLHDCRSLKSKRKIVKSIINRISNSFNISVAEVGSKSLSAYHLEGSRSANDALNNEEYPIYCKLHGDFRYDSLKNLGSDLATQNEHLSKCLVNASSRFGFVVTGYSG